MVGVAPVLMTSGMHGACLTSAIDQRLPSCPKFDGDFRFPLRSARQVQVVSAAGRMRACTNIAHGIPLTKTAKKLSARLQFSLSDYKVSLPAK
jgi:hypothetical protein